MAQNANPENAERKKQILAGALGVLALALLGYTLFGGSSGPNKPARKSEVVGANSNTNSTVYRPLGNPNQPAPWEDPNFQYFPIAFSPVEPAAGGTGRNIFAFPPPPPPYIPPTPKPIPPTPPPPPPTPTPPPPLLLSSVSPGSTFAGTGDFTLTVAGDKFTPETHIYFGDRDLPTRFVGAQQLIATVPGDLIKYAGARQIIVRTPDNLLYSNTATLAVQEPPKPDNFAYVGMMGTRFHNDKAIIKDKSKSNKPGEDLEVYQRGEVIGGRFKILSISQQEVVLVDTALKLTHRLPMEGDKAALSSSPNNYPGRPRYQPPPASKGDDDDEEDP